LVRINRILQFVHQSLAHFNWWWILIIPNSDAFPWIFSSISNASTFMKSLLKANGFWYAQTMRILTRNVGIVCS
jgi:hypothetical protein